MTHLTLEILVLIEKNKPLCSLCLRLLMCCVWVNAPRHVCSFTGPAMLCCHERITDEGSVLLPTTTHCHVNGCDLSHFTWRELCHYNILATVVNRPLWSLSNKLMLPFRQEAASDIAWQPQLGSKARWLKFQTSESQIWLRRRACKDTMLNRSTIFSAWHHVFALRMTKAGSFTGSED